MALLRYGHDSAVDIDLANGYKPGELSAPRGQPLADVTAATIAALGEPIEYPSLARCMTPGDRVVLALDRGIPQAGEVTAAVIQSLVEAGLDPDGIAILRCGSDREGAGDNSLRSIPPALQTRVTRLVHDPADRRQLAYLAADKSGEAILINRALHEADAVLPIGCLHGDEAAGYFGIHSGIYPTFSHPKTLQRFRSFASLDGHGKRKRELAAEADYVAWLLGINFTIQVVPAAGHRVMHVLAGQSDAVRQRGRDLYREAWAWPASTQASLVVAGIEGGAGQQTWENVGRALEVAGRFAEEGGSIAVCCDLSTRPGPAMQHLARASSREAALRHVGKERPIDALPAAQLARTLDRNRVYFLSRLAPSVVEDLEMVPIEGPDELVRLAHHHASCVVVSNAPYVMASE